MGAMREEKQSHHLRPGRGEGNGAPGVVITRSNPVAPDPRVEKIARALQGKGYRVSIVAWDRSGQFVDQESLEGQRLSGIDCCLGSVWPVC